MTDSYDCSLLIVTQIQQNDDDPTSPMVELVHEIEDSRIFSGVRMASLEGSPSIEDQLTFLDGGDLVVIPMLLDNPIEWQRSLHQSLRRVPARFRVMVTRSLAESTDLLTCNRNISDVCIELAIERMSGLNFAAA